MSFDTLSPKEKCDAIFDWADKDRSGKVEIAEVWRLITSTTGMNECEARAALTEEAFTLQMMPMLGGEIGRAHV